MTRHRTSRGTEWLFLAAAACAAAGIAVAYRLGALPGRSPDASRPGGGGGEPEAWTCPCGTAFRRVGLGRHRVYWLADAPEGDPLLGTDCPTCERPLPVGD
jgi:hypothetical protein